MASWQIGEAKERFSELLDEAHEHGAQFISENGTERAVLLSVEEYRQLSKREPTFVEFLLSMPKVDLEVERDQDTGRDIEL